MASPLAEVPVVDGLAAWAQAWPEETLFIWLRSGAEAERLSFGALWRRAGAVAAALLGRWGARRGDCVLLVYPPGLEFVVALFACFRAGVVAVPVYPPDPSKALAPQLAALGRVAASAGARTALTDSAYYWVVAALRLRFRLASCWPALAWRSSSGIEHAASAEQHFAAALEAAPPPRPSDVAFLQFTSGSTSAPKGVVVTHGCLAHNCALIRRAMGITAADCEVSWLPQYHDMGLVGGMLTAMTVPVPRGSAEGGGDGGGKPMRSAPCVFMSPVDFLKDPLAWPRALSRYGATHTQAPDFAYALTSARAAASPGLAASLDLSPLRRALNGAEAVRPATMAAFAAAFAPAALRPEALVAGYGLAEHVVFVTDGGREARPFDRAALQRSTGAIARPPPPDAPPEAIATLHACGVPAADAVDLRIVCPHTRRSLPAGAVGEIWLRSRSVAAGYWRQPQLSREVFHAALADEIQEDAAAAGGYLRTGDLGFVHPKDGALFFVGRMKDVLVIRGRNVAPEDVEAAALASAPQLRPGCAAAFCAAEEAVVLVCEARSARIGAAEAGAAAAAARLAVAALGITLADVVLLPPRSIPKTTSGKVRRFEVRRLYIERALPSLEAQQHFGGVATSSAASLAGPSPLQAGLGAALAALPRPARRAALRRRVAAHVAAVTGLPPPGAHSDLLAAGLDSAALAALHGALEFALGAPLPPALLLDARTPAALAAALDAARWPPAGADDADAECAAAAWEAHPDAEDADEAGSSAYQHALPQLTAAQRRAGAAMAALAAVALLAHAVSMTHLRGSGAALLNLWRDQPASVIAGAAYRAGWLPGRRVDCAHWRLLEWARTVLPIQLVLNGTFAALTLRSGATSSRHAPSPRFLTALFGLLHAMALHGVWALPLLALALCSFAAGRACVRLGAPQLRPYAAWALALAPMAVYNAVEPGNLLWGRTIAASARAEAFFLKALLGEGGRPYEGLLAATSFTANRTFRYLALRAVSYHIDNGAASAPQSATLLEDLELFLAYVLYAPLYLCGPVMTFGAFRASPAAATAAGADSGNSAQLVQPPAEACAPATATSTAQSSSAAIGWRAAARAVGGAVAAAVAMEVACHTVYLPSALLFPRFSHGDLALQSALRCADWAVAAFGYLTATWLTSAVVFAVPRGVAAAQRVAAPHDTPLFWTAASASCRRYWAHFHASLFAIFARYIFLPLGAGSGALLATVAFSTFIHGFHAHWLLWGLGNAATLAAERALACRCGWYARPAAPLRAANQAAAVGLMAALTMGAQLPPRGRGCVAAAVVAFAALNAVWLGR